MCKGDDAWKSNLLCWSIKVFVKMKTVVRMSKEREKERGYLKQEKKNKCNHLIDQKAFPFHENIHDIKYSIWKLLYG